MNIASICKRRIVTVDSAGTLEQAAGLMREHHVGALVVTTQTDEGGMRVAGVVTDRDLVVDVLARGLDVTGVRIGELTRGAVVSVAEDDDLVAAIAAMQDSGVRRLLVSDAERRLVGIVSLDDLMDACAREIDGLAKVIRSGIDREVTEADAAPLPVPLLRIPAMGTAGWGKAIA